MMCISLSFYILFYSDPKWTEVLTNVNVDEFREVAGPATPLPHDISVLGLSSYFSQHLWALSSNKLTPTPGSSFGNPPGRQIKRNPIILPCI